MIERSIKVNIRKYNTFSGGDESFCVVFSDLLSAVLVFFWINFVIVKKKRTKFQLSLNTFFGD